MKRIKIFTVAMCLFLPVLVGIAWSHGGTDYDSNTMEQLPEKYTNLQVLPKDIEAKQLVGVMRNFAIGLGVRCWYCHEGEGDDFSTFDFAADTKQSKEVARQMLNMVEVINDDHLKNLDSQLATGQRVTCITCHQKQSPPPKSQ